MKLAAVTVPSDAQTSPALPAKGTQPHTAAAPGSSAPVGVFRVILLLVPGLPYLEALSDCVKDTIRATVESL